VHRLLRVRAQTMAACTGTISISKVRPCKVPKVGQRSTRAGALLQETVVDAAAPRIGHAPCKRGETTTVATHPHLRRCWLKKMRSLPMQGHSLLVVGLTAL
jgi:hypothetical protein